MDVAMAACGRENGACRVDGRTLQGALLDRLGEVNTETTHLKLGGKGLGLAGVRVSWG